MKAAQEGRTVLLTGANALNFVFKHVLTVPCRVTLCFHSSQFGANFGAGGAACGFVGGNLVADFEELLGCFADRDHFHLLPLIAGGAAGSNALSMSEY